MQDQKKPSKLMAVLALACALVLPFFMVNTLSHHQPSPPIKQAIHLPKQANVKQTQTTTADSQWVTLPTSQGDSLTQLFKQYHLNSQQIHSILNSGPLAAHLNQLRPNEKIRILKQGDRVLKLMMPVTATQSLLVYQQQTSEFSSKLVSRHMSRHNHHITATVEGSLYATAKKLALSKGLIYQMTKIFAWEMDFSRDVHDGDQFTIIYSAYYSEDKMVGTGQIIALTYNAKQKTHQAFLHEDEQGNQSYYNADGHSLKKAFDRYPVQFSHISSTFSTSRHHPVLNYKRPHKGVDLAAPLGKPIQATSDGRIEKILYSNGYGNMIKIRHNNAKYATVYAHMHKFVKGLSKGSHVTKGQVIGYVGQSGLATGPHCHFEFHIHNQPTNPTTVTLPRAPSIPKQNLAQFKARSATLLAQLKLFEEANRLDKHSAHKAVV